MMTGKKTITIINIAIRKLFRLNFLIKHKNDSNPGIITTAKEAYLVLIAAKPKKTSSTKCLLKPLSLKRR
jgi:hypothetical protein